MANSCHYEQQLRETCRLVSEAVGVDASRWKLVYQSRSGRPQDPWLEPDICDHIEQLHTDGVRELIVMPIGFLSDHIEVLYDLDDEAAKAAERVRHAHGPGPDGRHASAVRADDPQADPGTDVARFPKEAIGQFGPNWDVCRGRLLPGPGTSADGAATVNEYRY